MKLEVLLLVYLGFFVFLTATGGHLLQINSDLASALENGSPSSPHSLPADNVSSDIDLRIHKASLLQGYVVIQICFDGGTFLSHDFGFDGSDFLH